MAQALFFPSFLLDCFGMTPEEKALLERAVALSEENNVLLKKMLRSAKISTFLRVCYWVLIIGFSFGAFYLIQPYINTLQSTVQQLQGNTQSNSSVATGGSADLQSQVQTLNSLLKKI